jgi:hypothetical protein
MSPAPLSYPMMRTAVMDESSREEFARLGEAYAHQRRQERDA